MNGMSGEGIDPSEWLERAAREAPERMAVRMPDGTALGYAELNVSALRLAAALQALGIVPGERVATRLPKSLDAILIYLACLHAGAVFVPINVASAPQEVDYLLRDSAPRLLVLAPEERAAFATPAQGPGVPLLHTLDGRGGGSLAQLAREIDPPRAPSSLRADALAALVYTSGTTGRPKGAMLTRGNLGANADALARAWRFTGNDVLLHALPLFHVHGLFVAINTVLAAGAGLILLARFDATEVLQQLPAASVYMGVPTHYTRLLQLPGLDRTATAHVRLFVSGSAPLLASTHAEFLRRTGHHILERYGMTETLMITSNPYDGERIPGAVGPPLPGMQVRVAAAGSIGVLEVRGPSVFAGYWNDPRKTREEFTDDGWFKTGDLGRIDAQGYVHIVGRAKDLVISGGYNVYPKEVERELDSLPGVIESAVFGVPHPDFGEGVTAAVVPEPGAQPVEADLIAALRPRLAAYKLPKRVLLVRELPRNAMGKVRKEALRQEYAALYAGR